MQRYKKLREMQNKKQIYLLHPPFPYILKPFPVKTIHIVKLIIYKLRLYPQIVATLHVWLLPFTLLMKHILLAKK